MKSGFFESFISIAFESKDDIAYSVKHHLEEVMSNYGFLILQALVTEMAPDARVRDAMNEINSSKRLKEAAYQRAEGEKIVKVKIAEAAAESMYLSGMGVSRQRKAIMDGFRWVVNVCSLNSNLTRKV